MQNVLKTRLVRLFSFMWKDGGNILLGLSYTVSMLVIASQTFLFNYIAAIGLKKITDSMLVKDTKSLIDGIVFIAKGFGLIMVVSPIFGYIYQYSIRRTTVIIKENLFKKILSLSMNCFEKRHSGDLISRLNNDVGAAEGAYSWQVMVLVMALISAVGSTVVLLSINKTLFLYAILTGFVNFAFNLFFIKPLKIISDKIQSKFSEVTSRFSDIISGAFVIRSFSIGKIIFDKFIDVNMSLYRLSLKRVHYNSILASFNYSVGYLIFLGQIVLGGFLIINHKLTFGSLMASVQMTGPLIWLFGAIGQFLTSLQGSLAGAQRVFEILDLADSEIERQKIELGINNKDNFEHLNLIEKGSDVCIEFKDVYFSYQEDQDVLKGISFKVLKNSKVAFVGESGGGKSTIFKLLLGFYGCQQGKIYVFEKPVEDYSKDILRSLISYVPQDVYLFNGTVFENIRYGNLTASKEEVVEAAKKANAHEFIMNLSDGYDTKVGEKGILLSGGQRQRIAIARAILKNAPILLLDEATSSLDSESEEAVVVALNNLMQGKTTLIIAHRLSTIQNADIIYVVEDGMIVESGSHEDLLKQQGKYAMLYNKQFAEINLH